MSLRGIILLYGVLLNFMCDTIVGAVHLVYFL